MLLEERPLTAGAVPDAAPPAAAGRLAGRGPLLLVAGSLLLAALTLLAPSAPTYDPWAWIVWGREVLQLDLQTTAGPSWKPGAVLFTVPFSLFGDAAPDLWLVVARAGFFAAVGLAFVLARRLGGGVAGGLAAAAALALAPWFARNAALGNSEPLLVALLLASLVRLLEGRHGQAFALGVGAGLLRPEAWPFLGVYGLWLLWRRELPARYVVGAGAATVALWTLPELWGSGDALRAISRAQDPNPGAATFDDHPALRIVEDAFRMLPATVVAALAATLALLGVRRDRKLAAVLLVAAAWVGLVAIMTSGGGFSGNQRYLIPPVALAMVVAGAGAGWALQRLTARSAVVTALAAVALGAAFGAPHLDRLKTGLETADYQAKLTDEIGPLVDRAGGRDALLRCGRPYTGPFLVPHVAWVLDVPTARVALEPVRPAVVFRVQTIEGARAVPSLQGLDDGRPVEELAAADHWRVLGACG